MKILKIISGIINRILSIFDIRLIRKSSFDRIIEEREQTSPDPEPGVYGLGYEEFIRVLFQLLLEREPDETGLEYYAGKLRSGEKPRFVVESICNSEEYIERYIPTLVNRWEGETNERIIGILRNAEIPHLLHEVRQEMVRTLLPPAKRILDLGGASSSDPRGALLTHGYPHEPGEICIVDLPPDERMFPVKEFENAKTEYRFGKTDVRYYYHSMTDLSGFEDESFDMVWSGESVEHITREELIEMCADIRRILKPGGYFCFDTPNRAVTRLHTGEAYIHPEHKHEYTFSEMEKILKEAGYKIEKTHGLVDMSGSLKKKSFSVDEFHNNCKKGINRKPESSYLFYFRTTR